MSKSPYQTQCNSQAGVSAEGYSIPACTDQTSPASQDLLLDSIQDLLRSHRQSLLEEVSQVVSSSINDLKDELQDYSSKSLEAVLETQQDVANLSAEVSSLRQAQLALRQQLNHDKSMYEARVQRLEDIFRKEIQVATIASNSAQKEARSLRRELQQTHRPSQFPQFSKLPPEIRHMIWDFALPINLLSIYQAATPGNGREWFGWKFKKSQPPPPIAQACREGRAVARRTGAMFPIDNTRKFDNDSEGESESESNYNYWDDTLVGEIVWSWFDPARDNLSLQLFERETHLESVQDIFQRLDEITKLATCARHITLDCGDTEYIHVYLEYVFNPNLFACLERVDIVARQCYLKERTDPILEALIFGSNKTQVTIDLDTYEEFIHKLRLHHTSPLIDDLEEKLANSGISHWLNPLGEHTGVRSWSNFMKGVKKRYLIVQHHWSPLGGVKGPIWAKERKVGASPQWIKALERKMPSFRQVALANLMQ